MSFEVILKTGSRDIQLYSVDISVWCMCVFCLMGMQSICISIVGVVQMCQEGHII